jgi:hypothetical protein
VDERFVKKVETDDLLQRIEETIRRRLAGSVRDLHLILSDHGVVMRGCVRSYYSKQLAQQAVMEFTKLPILANEIEVTWAHSLLRAANVFRWIDGGCPKTVVGTPVTRPYQVQGRLLNGNEALICTLSHGSCEFQTEIPTTGGRHTDVCVRQKTADLPFGATPR